MTDPTRVERITQDDRDTSWQQRAACRKTSTVVFFSEWKVPAAKALCATCTERVPCLALGMTQDYGVFGGKTEAERQRIRKAQRGAA